jgi:hypothetical protein
MCEIIEEEREEAIARDLFGYDDGLEFLDSDDAWDQEGPATKKIGALYTVTGRRISMILVLAMRIPGASSC